MENKKTTTYNAHQKEAQLRAESEAWDTSTIEIARQDDIPIIDLQNYFANPNEKELDKLATQLLYASTKVGFFYITGHGVPSELINGYHI